MKKLFILFLLPILAFAGFYAGPFYESGQHQWRFYTKQRYAKRDLPRSELKYAVQNYGILIGVNSSMTNNLTTDVNIAVGIPRVIEWGMQDRDWYPLSTVYYAIRSNDQSIPIHFNLSLIVDHYDALTFRSGIKVDWYFHRMYGLIVDKWKGISCNSIVDSYADSLMLTYEEMNTVMYVAPGCKLRIADNIIVGGEFYIPIKSFTVARDQHIFRGLSLQINADERKDYTNMRAFIKFDYKDYLLTIEYQRLFIHHIGYGYCFKGKYPFRTQGNWNKFQIKVDY